MPDNFHPKQIFEGFPSRGFYSYKELIELTAKELNHYLHKFPSWFSWLDLLRWGIRQGIVVRLSSDLYILRRVE